MKTTTTITVFWLATLACTEAGATDFRAEAGASAAGTEWRGDPAGYGHLALGFRFLDLIGIYAKGELGYAAVDTRMLTALSVGVQGWTPSMGPVRLNGRLGFVHQHEESISVVAGDVGSALLGLGEGIRHRGGFEVGVGIDVPFHERGDMQWFAKVEANAKIFPDDLGPLVYAGGGAGLGFNYAL